MEFGKRDTTQHIDTTDFSGASLLGLATGKVSKYHVERVNNV